jgi:hemoglobin
MRRRPCGWGLVMLGLLLIAGCAGLPAETTLYERLGGVRAIYVIVDDFVGRVTTDARIDRFFKDTNLPLIREQLTQLICQASRGPCTYLGANMKIAHSGMGISNADFDAVAEDLTASLDKFNVAPREKNELLAILARMRSDIVEKQ